MFRESRARSDRPSRARGRQLRGPGARRRRRAAGARDPRAGRRARRCATPRVGSRPHCPCHPRLVSSRASQARAVFQSLFTVRTETPNASAVSSMLNPPKKRNSTTRLARGATSAEHGQVHRRAPPRPRTALVPAGRYRRATPARHRRGVWWPCACAAASTSTRRMIVAVVAKKCARFCHVHRLLPSDEPQVGFVDELGCAPVCSATARRRGSRRASTRSSA